MGKCHVVLHVFFGEVYLNGFFPWLFVHVFLVVRFMGTGRYLCGGFDESNPYGHID